MKVEGAARPVAAGRWGPGRAVRRVLLAAWLFSPVAESCGFSESGGGASSFRSLLDDLQNNVNEAEQLQEVKNNILAQADANEQQKSLTVFALGRLLAGDEDSAKWARTELEKRYPASRYKDAFRPENISKVCDKCKGDGKRNEPCRGCHGKKVCASCKGKGTMASLSKDKNTCPGCGGSGKCPICKGSGHQTVPCAFCAQRGRLYDPYTIRNTIEKLMSSEGPPASLSASVTKAKENQSSKKPAKKPTSSKKGKPQGKKK